MYCAQCGKEILADAKFCPYCGGPQNVAGSDRKRASQSISVVVYIDSIRLNISSVDNNIMDEINGMLTAQFSNNEFISQRVYKFNQSTGDYRIDWFMPLAVKDLYSWEDFLCNVFKAVSTYLLDIGFRYYPDRRLFEKGALA